MSNNNAPPRLAAPRTACLLIHGFGGTPFEMEALAPGLEALGCTVDMPTLPGHGTSIPDFRRSFFRDWMDAAEKRFLSLARDHDLVIPVGFSMGGSIALTLAAKYADMPQTQGVVAIASPHTLYRFWPPEKRTLWLLLTPLLQYLRPEVPIPPRSAASTELAPFQGYDGPVCMPQLWSMVRGVAAMRAALPRLACPLLLLYEVNDRVCWPENALKIARAVSSTDITVHWLRMQEKLTSHHMLTTHRDTREQAAARCASFVQSLMRGRSRGQSQ